MEWYGAHEARSAHASIKFCMHKIPIIPSESRGP